mgnify:CR=1 FL=1
MHCKSFYDSNSIVALGGSNYDAKHNIANQKCYFENNNISYLSFTNNYIGNIGYLHFNKIHYILKAMKVVTDGTWLLWVDRDILFTNMNMCAFTNSIPNIKKDLIVPQNLNNGMFLIRKTCWSYKFLERWLSYINHSCIRRPMYDMMAFIMSINSLSYNFTFNCHNWTGYAYFMENNLKNTNNIEIIDTKLPLYPHIHFLGSNTHLSVRKCYKETLNAWITLSNNTCPKNMSIASCTKLTH